jgi:hypothetical protein
MCPHEEQEELTCLEEFRPFARLEKQNEFVRKYWYRMATLPILLATIVGIWVFGDSSSRGFEVLLYAALAWALLVAGYALINVASRSFCEVSSM